MSVSTSFSRLLSLARLLLSQPRRWGPHIQVKASFSGSPLLNNNTASLQFRHVAESGRFVREVLVGEGGHECVGSGGAGSVGAIDKVVDIANRVCSVEARL